MVHTLSMSCIRFRHCFQVSSASYFSCLLCGPYSCFPGDDLIVLENHLQSSFVVWAVKYPSPVNTPTCFVGESPTVRRCRDGPTSHTVADEQCPLSTPSLAMEHACHLAEAHQTNVGTAADHPHQWSGSQGSRVNTLAALLL